MDRSFAARTCMISWRRFARVLVVSRGSSHSPCRGLPESPLGLARHCRLEPESVLREIKVSEFDRFLYRDEKERSFWTAGSLIAAYD